MKETWYGLIYECLISGEQEVFGWCNWRPRTNNHKRMSGYRLIGLMVAVEKEKATNGIYSIQEVKVDGK